MTLLDYARVLRRRWVSISAVALVGLLAAAAATFFMPKAYRAQSTSFVSISASGTSASGSSIYQGSQFAISQVQSYTQLATSPMVLQPVIKELGLSLSMPELQSMVAATSPQDSVLLRVDVTDSDPALAAKISNATSRQLGKVIKDLASPVTSGSSFVDVTLTQPAVTPDEPVSPRPPLNMGLGLILGLALGAGWAVLREQFDTTVSSMAELQSLTGMKPLGVVERFKDASKQRLVALDPMSEHAEAYRTLRTNLQLVDVDSPPRTIVVTSAAPAEGKTTVACNFAITLARSGQRVCLMEADLRRAKVCEYLGVEGSVGLTNVLAGQQEHDDVLIPWHENLLTVIGPGTLPPDPSHLLASHAMSALVRKLSDTFDYVIIDAPPLLAVPDAAVVARIADGALLVVKHRQTTREQVRSACEGMDLASSRLLGTVLTCVPPKEQGDSYRYVKALPHQSLNTDPDIAVDRSDRSGASKTAQD